MEQDSLPPIIIDLSQDSAAGDQHLSPPIRIVPSQRRQDTTTSWLQSVSNGLPHVYTSGGWTTASLIGIGALPATSLRNLQVEGEGSTHTSRAGSERNKKQYPCPGCDVVFERLSALKQHLLSHTGEKPHACDMCGRRFSISSNLRRHSRTCKVGKFKTSQGYPAPPSSSGGIDNTGEYLGRTEESAGTPPAEYGYTKNIIGLSSSLPGSDGEDSVEAESPSRSSPLASAAFSAVAMTPPPNNTIQPVEGDWGLSRGDQDVPTQRDRLVHQNFPEPLSQVSQSSMLASPPCYYTSSDPPPNDRHYASEYERHRTNEVFDASTSIPLHISESRYSEAGPSQYHSPIPTRCSPSIPPPLPVLSGQNQAWGQVTPDLQAFQRHDWSSAAVTQLHQLQDHSQSLSGPFLDDRAPGYPHQRPVETWTIPGSSQSHLDVKQLDITSSQQRSAGMTFLYGGYGQQM